MSEDMDDNVQEHEGNDRPQLTPLEWVECRNAMKAQWAREEMIALAAEIKMMTEDVKETVVVHEGSRAGVFDILNDGKFIGSIETRTITTRVLRKHGDDSCPAS